MAPDTKEPAGNAEQLFGLSGSEVKMLLMGLFLRTEEGKVCVVGNFEPEI